MRLVDALVFSGGGARGAYQIGVYEALTEHGFQPEIVTGTSVGAILATLVASRCPPSEIKRLWRKACEPGFLPYRRDVYRLGSWTHVRDNQVLEDLLREEVDWDAVRRSRVDLRFTAVDVATGERVTFTNETATPKTVLASTAVPLLFEPEPVDGRHLWDGGLMTSTPLQPAIEDGATRIYAIVNEPVNRVAPDPPSSLAEAFDRVVDIVNQRALRQDLDRAQEINELVLSGQAADYWRYIEIDLIAPDKQLETSILDFREDDAEKLWTLGYDDAVKLLEGRHEQQDQLESAGEPGLV